MINDLAHIPVFAGIAALLFAYVATGSGPLRRVGIVVSMCAALGLAVEVIQLLTGAGQFQVQDLWFDLVGTTLGLAVASVGLLSVRRSIFSVLVVIGAVVGVVVVPQRDGLPKFEYASDAVERRCATAPTADIPSGGDTEALALYLLEEGQGSTTRDASGDLGVTIADPADDAWAAGGGLRFLGGTARASSDRPAAALVAAVRASDQVSVEAWFTPTTLPQTGPARIVTISSGPDFGEANVHVGIEGRAISFRVMSDCDFFNTTFSDDVLEVGQRTSVVATYRPGLIEIFVDGRRIVTAAVPNGGLGRWDADMRLHLGNEASGDRPFVGTIDHVAVFDRALNTDDVDERYTDGSAR